MSVSSSSRLDDGHDRATSSIELVSRHLGPRGRSCSVREDRGRYSYSDSWRIDARPFTEFRRVKEKTSVVNSAPWTHVPTRRQRIKGSRRSYARRIVRLRHADSWWASHRLHYEHRLPRTNNREEVEEIVQLPSRMILLRASLVSTGARIIRAIRKRCFYIARNCELLHGLIRITASLSNRLTSRNKKKRKLTMLYEILFQVEFDPCAVHMWRFWRQNTLGFKADIRVRTLITLQLSCVSSYVSGYLFETIHASIHSSCYIRVHV